jgi:hypothetical protein
MEKTSDCYGTLYLDNAMNVKTSDYYGTHMGCCNEWKKPATIMGPYVRVLRWMKNHWLLWDPICGYCNECVITTITCIYAGITYFGNI